ncbi:MAG: transcriptional repressor [Bacteroidales bacterium]|nr:transcriptional repressor [Bacteroidales bacterium]
MTKVENISEYLLKNDIKPSYQRMRVFEYLTSKQNHPTVDKIYKELIKEIPTLSKTTVYNTLKLFMEKGIVTVVNIEDNEVRYDADTSLHGHFKCEKCEEIYDFKINPSNIDYGEIKNFKINETHLYIKGVCDKCK